MDYLKRLFVIWTAIAMSIGTAQAADSNGQASSWWSEFLEGVVSGEGQVLLIVFSILVCLFIGCILKNPEIH